MEGRAWILRLVGPAIFLALYVYVCHQLVRFANFSILETFIVLGIILIPFAVFLGLPLFIWTRAQGKEAPWVDAYQSWAHTSISYLSYVIFFIVIRDILAFFDFQFGLNIFSYGQMETKLILILPLPCMFLGYLMAKWGPMTIHKKLYFQNLPEEVIGKKIVQISDLHIGPSVGIDHVRRTVDKANTLKPDYIVLTGDIFDGDLSKNKESVAALAELKPKEKTFYITGNHEYYWGVEPFIKKTKEMGFEVLLNENFKIGSLVFVGTVDPAARQFQFEGPNLEKSLSGTSAKDFIVLLAHQPNIATQAQKHNISLQLSGHTHAGQFLPWSLIIGLFQRYARGLYKLGNMQLYVNIGTGYWGPANRLGTFCEITEIELLKEQR